MSLQIETDVPKKKVVIKRKKKVTRVVEKQPETDIEIKLQEGLEYLSTLQDKSIDLVLTDPPYIISRDSGMNTHYNTVKENERKNVQQVKTQAEWLAYKTENGLTDDSKREKYIKYGTI